MLSEHTEFLANTNTFIFASKECGKSTLLKKIYNLLKDEENIEVELVSLNPNDEFADIGFNHKSMSECVSAVFSLCDEMMNRHKLIDKAKETNIYATSQDVMQDYPTKILIIDDLDKIFMHSDYKSIELLKTKIGSIMRLGKPAKTIIIASSSKPIQSRDITNNIVQKIIGYNDEQTRQLLKINVQVDKYMFAYKTRDSFFKPLHI